MGYSTGSSTGPDDLLDKLRLFLIAEGWTVNLWTTVGAGKRLHVQKTAASGDWTMFFNFRSATSERGSTITEDSDGATSDGDVTGIVVNGSMGYNAGNNWDVQPGYAENTQRSNYSFGMCISPVSVVSIPSYHFFTQDESVHVVVEIVSGKFQFISFGRLVKQGAYPGGHFFTGSFSSYRPYGYYKTGGTNYAPDYFSANRAGQPKGAVLGDYDGSQDWRISQGSGTQDTIFPCVVGGRASEYYSESGICSHFWEKSPNFYNSIPAFCPVYVFSKRSDGNYSLMGWPDGIRVVNSTNYSQGEEITYGGDTWMIFHADQLQEDPTNDECGFAFKKEV